MQARIEETTGSKVVIEEVDLLTLVGADREAAIGGLRSGGEFPFVIVDGVLASTGDLDLDRICKAVLSAAPTGQEGATPPMMRNDCHHS